MISRRQLLITLGACSLTAPFHLFAQQPWKVWRIGLELIAFAFITSCTSTPQIPLATRSEIAPTGTLRVGLYYTNPVLVQRDSATGDPRGVAADISRELARRIDVPIEFVVYDAAAKLSAAVKLGEWDIAFLAADPARALEISFAPPILEIEGVYLVPAGSPLRAISEVDREGLRIAVAAKNVYDLILSRDLKRAQLVRAPTVPAAIDMFVADKLDVMAGAKPQLVEAAAKYPGSRILDGRFMVVQLTAGVPKSREAAAKYLSEFIEDVKATGFVAQSFEKSGVGGASVALRAMGK
jgi:ABC-type amino acid transport substrate-binding protein